MVNIYIIDIASWLKITVHEFVNKYQNLLTTISSYATLIGYANQHIYLITSYCDFTIGKIFWDYEKETIKSYDGFCWIRT